MESNKIASILSLDNVTKTFETGSKVAAVSGITLDIRRGERIAIMGPSGSGKSTLLNLVCGLDEPTSGSVFFDGKDLSKLDDDQRTRLRREKIGMIFQTFNLLPTLTGVENVALPLRLNGVASKAASDQAGVMLKRVGLDERIHHRPDEMSGGERQRVAIARALIFDPLLLLADEPTGNLDSHTGDDVLNLLDDLHAEFDTTIVLVTHSDHAAEHCDRHVSLLDGEIVSDEPFFSGRPENFMTGALALITKRQWQLHKLRLILTTLGIALGVAIFFAIQATNNTLVDSLHTTIEKLAGKATLQITSGDSGFSQEYLSNVRSTAGVALSEPVIETMAMTKLAGSQKLLILGLDTNSDLQIYSEMFEEGGVVVANPLAFTSHEDSIAVSRKFADRFGLKDGDKLPVQVQDGIRQLTIRGFFRSVGAGEVYDGNVGVMDIAAAQVMFGRGERIDRIDLTNSPDVSVDELQTRLAAQLPQGIKVSRPDLRGQSLESSVSSVNSGLTILSFLAFIICAFLIFNSFSISLNQRWKEIGILRAIGVTRSGIQAMFLVEAALLGVVGSAIGVAAGFVLAKAAIGIVLNVSQTLYGLAATPKALEFNYVFAAEAVVVGVIASILAAWIPARAAGQLDPAAALHNIETRKGGNVANVPRIVLGSVFVIGGLVLTFFTRAGVAMKIQLVYVLLIQIGMILLLPKIIEYGGKILRPIMNFLFGVEGLIAVETMARSPHRTASTVGALMVGLAFVFSCAAFIVSQKAALNHSLDKSLNCDIQVASSQQLQSSTYHFSRATTEKVAALRGVDVFDAIRVGSIDYRGDTISVLAHDMNAYFTISPDLLDSGDTVSARAITSRGEGVLVSNNFALRWNLKLGDPIRLDTPGGSLNLPVVGMLDYYRSEKGTIFLDSSLYRKYWNDTDSDYIFINLKPGVDKTDFKQKVFDALAGDQQAFVYTHEEFKAWVSGVIDQFFTLMYLQMVIAIFVAALGLANTMIISVDERRRELGIFRAIGGLRIQVVKMVLLEAVAISLIGLAGGAILGILNAYYLVNTAAKVVAGFTVRLVFPYSMIAWALPLVVVVAVGSALWPAIKAARLKVVDAIGYE